MSNKNYNKYFEKKEKNPVQLSLDLDIQDNNIEENIVNDTVEETVNVEILENNIEQDIVNDTVEETVIKEIQNDQKVKVISKKLNIRGDATRDADVVTVVNEGELLTLVENDVDNGFYHVITSDGFKGYCMEEFVEIV